MNRKTTTGVKYLNIDHRSKYGHNYIVRVYISSKYFVVWTGNNFEIGEKVAKKVQQLISVSLTHFLVWYDYEREEWLKKNGY